MSRIRTILHHDRRQTAVVASLAFATVLCAAMLFARALYSGGIARAGLAWNLFLAWLPMLSALAAYNLSKRRGRGNGALVLPCLLLWLLFLPNAPYILTDMLHLVPVGNVPLWFDLILLITFGWTGAFLGLVSLYLMQGIVRRSAGPGTSWAFTATALVMAGFGVYLGRFPRWNSWDLFTQPGALLLDIWTHLRYPLAHPRTFAFSALFSLCLAAMYLMFVAAARLRPEVEDEW